MISQGRQGRQDLGLLRAGQQRDGIFMPMPMERLPCLLGSWHLMAWAFPSFVQIKKDTKLT